MRRGRRSCCAVMMAVIVTSLACDKGPTEPRTNAELFDVVWSQFDRQYPFFDIAGVDWAAMKTIVGDSVANATSDREVARLVGTMMQRLDDYHADLTTPYGIYAPPISYEHHYSAVTVRDRYLVGAGTFTPQQHFFWGHLANNLGYVHVATWAGSGWGPDIELVLKGLGAVQGIVIDLRDNTGGYEGNGLDVAGRFYDATRVYRQSRARVNENHDEFGPPLLTRLSPRGSTRFTGHVAVLTNRFNASASEDFLLMMRVLPQVTTVGDTTLGVGSNPLTWDLKSGWSFRLPRTRQATPDGFVYQRVGLPPAIPVRWTVADTAGGRDPYLETAMTWLSQRPVPTAVRR
jgi:peptidase S41-like protein/tricorn protease-like protein